ncbi:MAG: hypothetical protein K6A65_08595 [Succinivibrionaceae bacterium]|nr:hypothetical protein [Succinivibrionaceae bacterium]
MEKPELPFWERKVTLRFPFRPEERLRSIYPLMGTLGALTFVLLARAFALPWPRALLLMALALTLTCLCGLLVGKAYAWVWERFVRTADPTFYECTRKHGEWHREVALHLLRRGLLCMALALPFAHCAVALPCTLAAAVMGADAAMQCVVTEGRARALLREVLVMLRHSRVRRKAAGTGSSGARK